MRTCYLPLLLVSFLAIGCAAQEAPTGLCNIIFEGDLVITAVEQLQSDLNSENARMYASVFDAGATWDGPLGQNAIGPENIKRAAYLMFQAVGPLQCVLWVQRTVSADTWIVDMYQKIRNAHGASRKNIPTAPGSAPPPDGGDIRTTLVLRAKNRGWRVVAARVTDLRLSAENRRDEGYREWLLKNSFALKSPK